MSISLFENSLMVWVDYNFFDSYYFEFSAKLGNLGWKSMTTMRDNENG